MLTGCFVGTRRSNVGSSNLHPLPLPLSHCHGLWILDVMGSSKEAEASKRLVGTYNSIR